jgi:hypothetical protein
MFGWEDDSLQRAMDSCTEFNGVPSYCKALTVQSDSEINKCTLRPVLEEQIDGCECKMGNSELLPGRLMVVIDLEALPGCNPVQTGPADATMPACAPMATVAN